MSFVCSRNHGKGHPRPVDTPLSSSLAPGTLTDGLSGPLSPQPLKTLGTLTGSISEPVSLLSFNFKDISPQTIVHGGDLNMAGRARWVNFMLLIYTTGVISNLNVTGGCILMVKFYESPVA